MVKAQEAKEKDGFKTMKDYNQRLKNEQQLRHYQENLLKLEQDNKKRRLLKNLIKSQEAKKTQAYNDLETHMRLLLEEEKLREAEENAKFRLKKRLIQGLYQKHSASLA